MVIKQTTGSCMYFNNKNKIRNQLLHITEIHSCT